MREDRRTSRKALGRAFGCCCCFVLLLLATALLQDRTTFRIGPHVSREGESTSLAAGLSAAVRQGCRSHIARRSHLSAPPPRFSLTNHMRCNRPSLYSRRRLPRMSAGLGDLMNNFVNVSAITQLTEEVTARALAATTMKKKRNNVGCYDDGDGVLQMVFLANEDIPLVQGMWDPKNPLDFKLEYCQQQVAAAMSIPRPTRVLVLGLGVGAIPRTLHAIYPSLAADVVEIDNDVIDTCRSFFKLRDVQPGESGVSVHHGDATEFVKRETSKAIYDIVYMDAYNEKGIPSSLLTHSFYEDMISCLKPGGLLSINLIEDVDDADVVLDRAQEMLVDPLIIRAQSTSNQAIFGVPRAKKHESDKDTSNSRLFDLLNEMKTRAGGVDARLILPYSIAPQVLLAERLADVRARNFAWDDV